MLEIIPVCAGFEFLAADALVWTHSFRGTDVAFLSTPPVVFVCDGPGASMFNLTASAALLKYPSSSFQCYRYFSCVSDPFSDIVAIARQLFKSALLFLLVSLFQCQASCVINIVPFSVVSLRASNGIFGVVA